MLWSNVQRERACGMTPGLVSTSYIVLLVFAVDAGYLLSTGNRPVRSLDRADKPRLTERRPRASLLRARVCVELFLDREQLISGGREAL